MSGPPRAAPPEVPRVSHTPMLRAALPALPVLTAVLACHLDAQDLPPPPVVTAKVVERPVAATRLYVGDVRPTRTALVGADVEGRVVDYPAEEGHRVAAGDLLAKLRTRSLELDLAVARATLAGLEADLLELRNGPRPQERARAKAQLEVADAELRYRTWALHNAEELLGSGSSSEDAVREARRQAGRAEGERAAAEQALELLEAGTRPEQISRAEADVAAQRARIARLEDDLARHEVRAPFTGFVVSEETEVGAWLSPGSPVVRLIELDTVDVVLPVPEGDIASLAVGQAVDVEVPALAGQTFPGTITAITPNADPRARTLPVRIQVANTIEADQPLLKAGMFAQARLRVEATRRSLLVPADALVLGGKVPVVFVVEAAPDGTTTVRVVPVRTGPTDGGLVAVEADGLKAGDAVVVEGNERLRPGQQVHVTRSGD